MKQFSKTNGTHSQKHSSKHSPRNYAFIDSQNVHRSICDQGWQLDWRKFYAHLRDKLGVTKALLFIGHIDGNEALYKELKDAGFDLVFTRTVKIHKDGIDTVKGNVDTDLVLRAMIDHDKYEGAVIVTGDGDFHPLAKHLQSEGKLAKMVVPNRRQSSRLLQEFSTKIEGMDSLCGKLRKSGKPSKRRL